MRTYHQEIISKKYPNTIFKTLYSFGDNIGFCFYYKNVYMEYHNSGYYKEKYNNKPFEGVFIFRAAKDNDILKLIIKNIDKFKKEDSIYIINSKDSIELI